MFGLIGNGAMLLCASCDIPFEVAKSHVSDYMSTTFAQNYPTLQSELEQWDGDSSLVLEEGDCFNALRIEIMTNQHERFETYMSPENKVRQQSIPVDSWLWQQSVQYWRQ